MSTNLEAQIKSAEQEWMGHYKQGPTRLRWTEIPLQVGDTAPDFELPDETGNSVHLSSFWREQPALILFWRQFGCGCGMERAKRLQNEYADYVSAGAKIVVIGQGEPARAAAYMQKYGIPCPILCDPEENAYRKYGLLEGKPSQLLFDAPEEILNCELEAGMKLTQARREAGRPLVDNSWLLPGEFVVDRSGIIRLAYRWQYCEGFPNPLVHIAAIKEAIAKNGKA
jgi:peroxiredoxin Q/BCP